jgi:hypothetical protein
VCQRTATACEQAHKSTLGAPGVSFGSGAGGGIAARFEWEDESMLRPATILLGVSLAFGTLAVPSLADKAYKEKTKIKADSDDYKAKTKIKGDDPDYKAKTKVKADDKEYKTTTKAKTHHGKVKVKHKEKID